MGQLQQSGVATNAHEYCWNMQSRADLLLVNGTQLTLNLPVAHLLC